MSGTALAVRVEHLSHSYPPARRQDEPNRALNNIQFTIDEGDIFCLLGPNGSGKSTLFKILSTLIIPTAGTVSVFGLDLLGQKNEIRQRIGVVFQHPSLDKKLRAAENLLHHGHLYNMRGSTLSSAIHEMLAKVGISDRADDLVENLSGGMQRRVELAKSLLHHPRLLILDEPSTGLDPGARKEFGEYLHELRTKEGVTILLTTHILDEADRCERIAIVDQGKLVAIGTPNALKQEIGGDVISVASKTPADLCSAIKAKFGGTPAVIGTSVRIEQTNGHEFIPQLVHAFPGQIDAITLSKPTLEDVFIHKTGHTFWTTKD
jgi:ABC-2 type transport system ATP-binding protein